MNNDNRIYQVDRSWIRCPSKSFPGKFYYFNVLNGEAAWSLSDIEKRTLSKDFVHHVTDKYHYYPEPDTPPSEEAVNMRHGPNWFRKPGYPQAPQHPTSATAFSHMMKEKEPAFVQSPISKFPMSQQPQLDPYHKVSSWWAQMPLSQPMQSPQDLKRSSFELPHWEAERSNTFCPNAKDTRYYMNHEPQKLNENPFSAGKYCDTSTPFKRLNFEPPGYSFEQQKPQYNMKLFDQKDSKPVYEPNHNYWNMVQRRQSFDENCMPKFSQPIFEESWKPRTSNQEPVFQRRRTLSESSSLDINNTLPHALSMTNLKPTSNFTNFTNQQKFTQNQTVSTSHLKSSNSFNNFTMPQKSTQNFSFSMGNLKSNQDEQKMLFSSLVTADESTAMNPFMKSKDRPKLQKAEFKSPFQPFKKVDSNLFNKIGNSPFNKVDSTLFNKVNSTSFHKVNSTSFHDVNSTPFNRVNSKVVSNGNHQQVHNEMGEKENMNNKPPYKKILVQVTSDKRIALTEEETQNGFEKLISQNDKIPELERIEILETKTSEDSNNVSQQIFNPRKRLSNDSVFNNCIENPKRFKAAETEQATYANNTKNNIEYDQISHPNDSLQKGTEFSTNSTAVLTKDDLRYILWNRKKNKLNKPENNSKKKVTFNLGVEDLSDEDNMQEEYQENNDDNEVLTISMLRNLASESSKSDKWFVAIDTGVLLDEFEFMEDYVQSDTTCTLLIPVAVQMCLESLSQGEGSDRQQVCRARSIARALASPPDHIVLQLADEDTSPDTTVEDSIVNCCRQYLKDGYHVVLITNSDDLYQKAYAKTVYCFSIEDVKSAVPNQKPEITFDIQKNPNSSKSVENNIINSDVRKNIIFSDHFKGVTIENSFTLNNEKIPVNVARKGLLDNKSYQNMSNHSLFSKNMDVNNTEQHVILQKNSSNPKMLADGEDFNGNFFLAPKNLTGPYRDVQECDSESTLDLNQLLERCTLRNSSKENKKEEFNQSSNVEVSSLSKEAKDKKYKAKLKRMKNLNSYTLDEYLKKFIKKNKPSEEMIKTRIEEFVCSFTQILEETLSELLQTNSAPAIKSPPWELTEAVEGIKELYQDINSVKIAAERLSSLLHASFRDGKLKPNTNEFMRILGCGLILVQCLKSNLPACTSLSDAVRSLLALPRQMDAPPAPLSPDPPPPTSPKHGLPGTCRSNFIKKPSEIVKYLQKHFPDWRGQENQIENENSKIIRTSGKSVNLLEIANNKLITMKNGNEVQSNTKVLKDKTENNIPTSNVNQKDSVENKPKVKETGAKLLRTLALNTGLKKTKPKDVDVEKMEKINQEMTSMIDDIINGRVPIVPSCVSNLFRDDKFNTKPDFGQTKPVFNGLDYKEQINSAYGRKEITRKIKDSDLRQPVNNSSDVPKYTSVTYDNNYRILDAKVKTKINFGNVKDARKENVNVNHKFTNDVLSKNEEFSNKKTEIVIRSPLKPKIVKPIKDMEAYLKKMKKNFINIDVQEYSDKNTDDESQQLVINEDYCNKIDGYEDHRLNNGMDADTTNDSGIDVDSSKAYSMVKLFLYEFSDAFKMVYKFIDSVIQNYSDDVITEGKRRKLHAKASRAYEEMLKIMSNLKCIIDRENRQSTLLNLLSKADDEALSDVRITKYCRVVTKCLEQSQMLCNALRVVLNLTDESCDISFESYESGLQYYNIFE